jgi:hypothetical protein
VVSHDPTSEVPDVVSGGVMGGVAGPVVVVLFLQLVRGTVQNEIKTRPPRTVARIDIFFKSLFIVCH